MAGKRILVIDDDVNFRGFMREILSTRGYDVREAGNGREAQEQLEVRQPDLILLDVMMPDLDGISLCREIRAKPRTQHVPILIISALSDSGTVKDALMFGATDVLAKPVDIAAFVIRIDKIFKSLAKPSKSTK